MSIQFDKNTFDFMDIVPEDLRTDELYPKLQGLMNYIIREYAEQFEDIKYKYRGPSVVRSEVVTEIINELGYKYVTDIMGTINGTQFNSLIDFISLLNLLKGSRTGLELVLKLLGFDSDIKEWWEQTPKRDPYTFEIVVTMDANLVPNVFETLDKVKLFCRAYVFPDVENIDFRFSLSFAEKNLTIAGFFGATYRIPIRGRI